MRIKIDVDARSYSESICRLFDMRKAILVLSHDTKHSGHQVRSIALIVCLILGNEPPAVKESRQDRSHADPVGERHAASKDHAFPRVAGTTNPLPSHQPLKLLRRGVPGGGVLGLEDLGRE